MKLKKIFSPLLLIMLNSCAKGIFRANTPLKECAEVSTLGNGSSRGCRRNLALCSQSENGESQNANKDHEDGKIDSHNEKIVPDLECISIFKDSDARRLAIRLADLFLFEKKDPRTGRRTGMKVSIVSDRFKIDSLYSPGKCFADYDEDIQKLYDVTLGDSDIMQKYGFGKKYALGEFEEMVNESSRRWEHGYPFAGFIIRERNKDKGKGEVVGYEAIADFDFLAKGVRNLPNRASMSICLRKAYQRCDLIQDVGQECTGALCLVYGQYLFDAKQKINMKYENNEYKGGQVFQRLQVTTRGDSFSRTMPIKAGFQEKGEIERYGRKRVKFEKVYQEQKEKAKVEILPWDDENEIPDYKLNVGSPIKPIKQYLKHISSIVACAIPVKSSHEDKVASSDPNEEEPPAKRTKMQEESLDSNQIELSTLSPVSVKGDLYTGTVLINHYL